MPEEFILPTILILFIPFWAVVSLAMARSGWNKLARRYPARSVVPREVHRFSSVVLNQLTNYNGCVTVGFTDIGVYMKVLPIFPFHEPMLIPYQEFHPAAENSDLLFFAYTIGEPKVADVSFGPFVSEHLKKRLSAQT